MSKTVSSLHCTHMSVMNRTAKIKIKEKKKKRKEKLNAKVGEVAMKAWSAGLSQGRERAEEIFIEILNARYRVDIALCCRVVHTVVPNVAVVKELV